MKYLLIVLLSTIGLNSFAQGIEFSHLTYEQAVAKAKAERKNIFVDAYTTWCGPCKAMAQNVFTQKQVGDYFNANFVNLKLDAENEKTHGFFKKYMPSAYPTYYWINPEGELLNTETGSTTAAIFVGYGKKASTSIFEIERKKYADRWEKGERSNELLEKYVYGMLTKIAPEQVNTYVESYISSLNDTQLQEASASRILRGYMRMPRKGMMFDLILKYHNSLEKNLGYLDYNQSMYRMIVRSGSVALSQKQDTLYRSQIALIKASPIPQKEMYLQILAADSLLYTGSFNKAFDKIIVITNKYGKDNPFLYREFSYSLGASGLMEKAELTPKQLDQLVDLTTKSFELNLSKEATTFLAASYAKKGDYKKAYEIASATQFYPSPLLPGGLFPKMFNIPFKITSDWGRSDEGKELKKVMNAKIEETGGKRAVE